MFRLLSIAAAVLLALLATPVASLYAQTARVEPTPYSTWLDFNRLARDGWPREGLPEWLESVTAEPLKLEGKVVGMTYRLRLLEIRQLNKEMQLRVFFDDEKDAGPKISGWSETGTLRFERGPLGAGLGLPTSETLTFSTEGVDFIEISVPGDAPVVRGVFLALLKTEEMKRALDFAPPTTQVDAFGNLPPAAPKADDLTLYGRVRARLDTGAVKLSAEAVNATWEFELEAPPLMAMVTFEVLGAEALSPLEAMVNDRPLGPVALHLTDLADPSYMGVVRPLDREMRFRYSGWLRGQKAIPGTALKSGTNRLTIQLHPDSGPVAVRAVEIQLKYNWKHLDYKLAPALP